MGQPISPKQGHEWLGKWSEPFVKGQQGRFTGQNVADQHSDKIDEVILTKTRTSETHLLLDRFEHTCMREHLRTRCHFAHPGWHGRLRFRRDLDGDGSMRHTTSMPSFFQT